MAETESTTDATTTDASTTSPTEDTERKTVEVATRAINRLIVHCADTPNGNDGFDTTDIDDWHRARGFLRKSKYKDTFNTELTSIGYHYVIYIDGSIHPGRHPDEVGAHVKGKNTGSLAVCMLGRSAYTVAQWAALRAHLAELEAQYPDATVHGHHEFAAKECPGFDVPAWLENGRTETPEHVYPPPPVNIPIPRPRPRPEDLAQ